MDTSKTLVFLSFIPLFLGSLCIAQTKTGESDANTPVATSPPNLVLEPSYVDHQEKEGEESDGAPTAFVEKLQYEPANSEKLILQDRHADVENKNGVHYQVGVDLFVVPKPDFVTKDEVIEEKLPLPIVQPDPSPCSKATISIH